MDPLADKLTQIATLASFSNSKNHTYMDFSYCVIKKNLL